MLYDLIVVSSYPRLGTLRDQYTVGVADYTKQTLTSLPSHLQILVLAEKIPGQPEIYTEKNITIQRIWTRNSALSFLSIFQEILKHPHVPILHEFEMAMYGHPLMNLFFVKLLFLLKLFLLVPQLPLAPYCPGRSFLRLSSSNHHRILSCYK